MTVACIFSPRPFLLFFLLLFLLALALVSKKERKAKKKFIKLATVCLSVTHLVKLPKSRGIDIYLTIMIGIVATTVIAVYRF